MSDLKIQCPECHESFEVPHELLGQDVECGTCNHPFTLSEDNIDQLAMRHFPGEKADGLAAFSKRAPREDVAGEVNFQTAQYDEYHGDVGVTPMRPRQIIAIFAGITWMALVIFFFVVSNGEGGLMTDVTNDKRWVLAGFSALVGGLLVVYGFRKYRVIGIGIALLFMCGLCYMPILYPENLSPTAEIDEEKKEGSKETSPSDELAEYKRGLGYGTLESKIRESEAPEKIVAVALMRAKPSHVDTIKDYLKGVLETDEIPRVYMNREVNGFPTTLIIYLNAQKSIEEAAQSMRAFGSITDVRPELKVVDVLVDVDSLDSANTDVLLNEEHPDFYQANLEELQHIDFSRQLAAILRLRDVERIYLKADIEQQLIVLLEQGGYPHRVEVVEALHKWSDGGSEVAEIILSQSRKLAVKEAEIPMSYLNFLVDKEIEGIGDVLLYAWMQDRVGHEPTLARAGKRAELALIDLLSELEPIQLQSAANVLRRVGSQDSLPALRAAYDSARGDVKKSLKATIDEIESRD